MFYEEMKNITPSDIASNEILKILDIIWLTIKMSFWKWESYYQIVNNEDLSQKVIIDDRVNNLISTLFKSLDKSQIVTPEIVKIIYFDLLKNWWISKISSQNLIIDWIDLNKYIVVFMIDIWMKILNHKYWFTTSWALIKTLKWIIS